MWWLWLIGCAQDPAPEEVATFATLDEARAIADVGLSRWDSASLPRDWIPTVWFTGLHALGEATGEPTWHEEARAWSAAFDAEMAEHPERVVSSDSLSPASVAASFGPDAFPSARAAADAYLERAPRTRDGAIEHWGPEARFGVPDQVWVDSLFMVGRYLLEEGRLDELSAQLQRFAAVCQDPADRLYRHAWDDVAEVNIPADAVYWARGNAWVLIAGVQLLAARPDDPARDLVLAHADALLAHQADDGLWHTVLNAPMGPDPANTTETSGSALIVAALAQGYRAGLFGDEVLSPLHRGVAGLRARIEDRDGVPAVVGTSVGTNPGDYAYYVSIGTIDDFMLGVGAVVLALSAVDGLPDAP